jgi:hypothetical protein
VKNHHDTVKPNQRTMIRLLKQVGLNVEVITVSSDGSLKP